MGRRGATNREVVESEKKKVYYQRTRPKYRKETLCSTSLGSAVSEVLLLRPRGALLPPLLLLLLLTDDGWSAGAAGLDYLVYPPRRDRLINHWMMFHSTNSRSASPSKDGRCDIRVRHSDPLLTNLFPPRT